MHRCTRAATVRKEVGALSDTRYARSGDLFIAYRVAGDGPHDLLLAPGYMSHVEQNYEWPAAAAMVETLASFSRVIVFDRRGSGLSDRLRESGNFDEIIEDISAVLDDAGSERATLVGFNDAGPMCCVYAATHPERTSALVLFNSYARGRRDDDYPWALADEEHAAVLKVYEEHFGRRPVALGVLNPPLRKDPAFRRWVGRAQRYGASPGAAITWYRMAMEVDIRSVLPTIRVPTLVLHRPASSPWVAGAARHLAENIPDARLVEQPGNELGTAGIGDWRAFVAELQQFVTGSRKSLEADRVLATVLFTDIVGSTQRALRAGDQHWRDTLTAHNFIVRRLLAEHDGREVNTTGDGFVATFDRPGAAIRCAVDIRRALQEGSVEVRAALHAGEVEVLGDDIGGIAVHIASRILSAAGPAEILVSSTVRDLVAGSGIAFDDRGEQELKDLPEAWHLYAVA